MDKTQTRVLPASGRRTTRTPRASLATASLLIGVLASACDFVTGPDDAGNRVEYSVDALEVIEEVHDWAANPVAYLRASLFAVNVSDDSVTVSMPSCILPLEAVPGSDVGDALAPVWRLVDRLAWPGGQLFACFFGLGAELGPGDTLRTLVTKVPLAEILADSLPVGRYRFQVRITSEVSTGSSSRTEDALVDLGEAYLPESRYPLSLGFYPRDGFFYRVGVSSVSEPGSDARAILEVTNWYTGTLTRDLSANCPVRLLAFRSADERETIPVPEPVWSWPALASCDSATLPVRLGPEEKRIFELDVPHHVVGATGERIEDFFFMAVIDVDGRPIRLAVDPCAPDELCALDSPPAFTSMTRDVSELSNPRLGRRSTDLSDPK